MVYVDPDDIDITPHLCLNGFWEPWITLVVARELQRGWHCLDVGANHGYYTLIMADAVEAAGRVLAIEPNPRLAELLGFTLEVNGFQRHTTVVQKAMSSAETGGVKLVIPNHRTGHATICREATLSESCVEVETTTIDRYTAGWPCVDFIKIDVEGAEEAIWQGMRHTLERNQSITVLMEIDCSRYACPASFLHEIQQAGFPLRYIDYDATIQPATEEQLLTDRDRQEWMLYLRRM
jgi:FkbM family methyltransferase